MRLHFQLSPNKEPVPFDYQHFLTGAFHKWLGPKNDLHDSLSLYSLSWLKGGRVCNEALDFPYGARWFISFYDKSLADTIVQGALAQPEVCCGMRTTCIEQQQTPHFGSQYTFKVSSPVLIKSNESNGKTKHYIYSDPEADKVMTATLCHKLDRVGLGIPHNQVAVRFDRTYCNPKTKLVKIRNTANRTSICPVIIEGTPEAIQFAWNVGIGHSTGSGFGALWE